MMSPGPTSCDTGDTEGLMVEFATAGDIFVHHLTRRYQDDKFYAIIQVAPTSGTPKVYILDEYKIFDNDVKFLDYSINGFGSLSWTNQMSYLGFRLDYN